MIWTNSVKRGCVSLNKKASINFFLVSLLISVIAFSVYYKYYVDIGESLVPKSQDIACRNYIDLKGEVGDIGNYLLNLNYKCHKDSVVIDSSDIHSNDFKEDVFKTLAKEERRCWYRYGEGKKDFLGHFGVNGVWCFKCAEIKYSKSDYDEVPSFKYIDYLNFLKSHKVNVSVNGKKKEVEYINSMRVKSYEVPSRDELMSIKTSIDDLFEDGDVHFKKALHVLNLDYLDLLNGISKEIDLKYPTYVVYIYVVPKKKGSDALNDAIKGAVEGMLIEQVGAICVQFVVSSLVCGVSTVATGGLAAFVCGSTVGKSIGKVGSLFKKGMESTEVVQKFIKIGEWISKYKKVRKIRKILMVTGEIEDLKVAASLFEDVGKVEEAKRLESIYERLKRLDVSVNKISKLSDNIVELEKEQEMIDKAFEEFSEMNKILDTEKLVSLTQKKLANYDNLETLNEIHKELNDLERKIKIASGSRKLELKAKYLKYSMLLLSGGTGAVLGYLYNGESNQYVDIMSPEEYYRVCGS